MLMHLVWFGESQMVHVPMVWTCLIVYGLMKDGCSLSDKDMGDLVGIFFQ